MGSEAPPGSILSEPQNVTRNKNIAWLHRAAARSAPFQPARKRPFNYSDRHLHNVEDPENDGSERDGDADGDGGNEETEDEDKLRPAGPPAKRRLMVFFNFSPENTQALSGLTGDFITRPDGGNGQATRHSIPQRNATHKPRRFKTSSLNEAQLAYADHLKREIAKVEEKIAHTEANIKNASRHRVGSPKTIQISAEVLGKAMKEATEASQAVHKAGAHYQEEPEVVEELRRLRSDNPTVLTEENLQNFEEDTSAGRIQRDAGSTLQAKQKRLNDVKTNIQIAEASMDPLNCQISELSDVLKAKKNVRRYLVFMHRIVTMGEKMEEMLGEKSLQEWLREQQV